MTTIRRRVLRPAPELAASDPRERRRSERQRAQLTADRQALRRWMSRLKRAFNSVDRLQARIARLERLLAEAA